MNIIRYNGQACWAWTSPATAAAAARCWRPWRAGIIYIYIYISGSASVADNELTYIYTFGIYVERERLSH
jgi:hypothetical protein